MEQKPNAEQEVRQCLATLRIIVFALATGLSFFIGYVLTAKPGNGGQQPILWMYMAIVAGGLLCARLVVPGIIYRNARQQIARGTWQPNPRNNVPMPETDEGQLMMALQTKTIIGCALLEGAGFNNAYAYMAERQAVSLVITLALILMIVAHFPLRFWLDGWLERQKQWLDEERSLQPADRHTP